MHVSGSDADGMAVALGAAARLGAGGEVLAEVGGGGGSLEVVRELLEWGAAVDARRLGDNATALMAAASRQRAPEVSLSLPLSLSLSLDQRAPEARVWGSLKPKQ